jgi:hypothetical protein
MGLQVHVVFAAGMMYYHHYEGVSDRFRHGWERYIQAAIETDIGPEMAKTYLGPRSNFWCAVDRRPDSPTHGEIIRRRESHSAPLHSRLYGESLQGQEMTQQNDSTALV